jgi:hypothetical protein
MKPATCSSCGAAITWAETAGGKRIPIDVSPSLEAGNVVLKAPMDPRAPWSAIIVSKLRPKQDGEVLYTSHFATCPQAARHRRRA